jgi:hypothetical protein
MTEIEGLDEIARRASVRVNRPSRGTRGAFGWGLSPNIQRSSPAREKTNPAPQETRHAPVLDPPPEQKASAVARMISDYNEFVAAVRDRVDEMGLTRHELDHQAGLQEGYSGKLLGPTQIRGFGKMTLGPTLGAIGCKLLLVEDPEQTAKMRARITPRQRPIHKQET